MIALLVEIAWYAALFSLVITALGGGFELLVDFHAAHIGPHGPSPAWVHEYLEEFDRERAIERIGPSLLAVAFARMGFSWLRSAVLP